MGAKKLARGMVIGALVGGAIALFDRDTRKEVVAAGKKAGNKVMECMKHPEKTWHGIREKVDEIQKTYREVNDDFRFIMEKAREIKEVSLETKELLRETKTVFQDESHGNSVVNGSHEMFRYP